MQDLTTIFLRIPRDNEITPEAAQTFLSTLTSINSVAGLAKMRGERSQALSLEIILFNQQIHFQITCATELAGFVEAQLQSNYPTVIMERVQDPLTHIESLEVLELTPRKGTYYPIATYPAFQEIDPMSSILTVLSKSEPNEIAMVQFALEGSGSGWQSYGAKLADSGGGVTEEGKKLPHPDAAIIKEKISYPGFYVSVRLASNLKQTNAELASSFGVYTRSDGNSFGKKKKGMFSFGNPYRDLKERRVTSKEVLNIVELATLWHLPNQKVKTASIAWGTSVLSEAPSNLPVSHEMSEEDKADTNFFGKTFYKNRDSVFGIKKNDRRRHIWLVGKTGTGKSTMIANMVIDDIKKGRGVGIIDPHGDLCLEVLNYIPSHRINDVIYFNPADRESPITINPLQTHNKDEAELAVSGLMSVFTKVWANVWSARMEYILRNSFMTLAQLDGTTFGDVLVLLTNKKYRDKVLEEITDPNLIRFWKDEYDKMPDRYQKEAIGPIQNKVGQFVTSPMIRRIINHPESSIDMDDAMNNGKIVLANLSQGRIGEDNSALLGAVLITKFQLAAMRRVNIEEEVRRDFFLYVDEFQNFATDSFIKILSEARKYRLALMLANQYMAQIPEEVQKAILGNAGTLVSFRIGAEDAAIVHKEFSETFEESDLVNLANFQIAVKLMIDGHSTRPFLANTLPLPASTNKNKEKVLKVSKERYGKVFDDDEMEKLSHHHKVVGAQNQYSKDYQQQNQGNNSNQNNNRNNNRNKNSNKNKNYKGKSSS